MSATRASLSAIVDACAAGALPANVALMQLIAAAKRKSEIDDVLSFKPSQLRSADGAERLTDLARLWQESFAIWSVAKGVLAAVGTGERAAVLQQCRADWRAVFDRAAGISADAAAALYLLGRDDLAAAAAASVIGQLRIWGCLTPLTVALDLGCGAGRLTAALAREVRQVVGIDVSPGMLDAARKRCRGVANVKLLACSGTDRAMLDDGTFNLVLVSGVFPYLVTIGDDLAFQHVLEASRVLVQGGHLVVLNYSYSGDLARDQAEIGRHAAKAGFVVVESGSAPFAHWDGRAFVLVKRPPAAPGRARGRR